MKRMNKPEKGGMNVSRRWGGGLTFCEQVAREVLFK